MKHRRTTTVVAVAAAALILPLTSGVAPAAAGTGHVPPPAPTSKVTPGQSGAEHAPSAGRYVVTLRDPAASTYAGGVAGKARTAPEDGRGLRAGSTAVRAYRDYLRQGQDRAAEAVGARVISSYSAALDGFTADLAPDQVRRLRNDPSVVAVVEDHLRKPLADTQSTDYLGLSGQHGVWAANGGVGNAGKGTVVGVVDTGIAPENPSFAGDPLPKAPGAEPYLDGSTVTYRKGDGGTFTGTCATGVQFTAADCSTKLVSARYFVDNFGADRIGTPATGEYLSPRDGESHGSHTSSTAVGDNGVKADVAGVPAGTVSGVSPAAKVAVYKACWSGPDTGTTDDDGCADGDLLAAIDAAVADNVDVINYSIGSAGGALSTDSVIDEAFRNAAAAGIFVATAGGNAGPGESTVDNAAPWVTTAAASTIPTREATVELGNGADVLGASVSLPADGGPVTGPLVAASAAGTATASRPNLCGAGTLDPAKVKGRVVLCERGVSDRLAKSAEVGRAGGIGMILVNTSPDSVDLDTHTVPTVAVDADGYDTLVSYAATDRPTATLVDGNPHRLASAPVPRIAGFSSRGPVTADGGDLIKPDLAAPGVSVLADGANAEGGKPTYTFMSGTSMASPHVAGLAALYLGIHPQATPAEIKSALMTTTSPTVTGKGEPDTDVFAQGNGQIEPTRYLDPGLLYLNGPADWEQYLAAVRGDTTAPAPSDLNLASVAVGSLPGRQTVTRTVTSTSAGTYKADPVDIPGIRTSVEPAVLTFTGPGQSKSFTLTFTRTTAPLDTYATGYLTWRDGTRSVRSALAVRPVALLAPARLEGTGNSGGSTAVLRGGDDRDVPVQVTGLARGRVVQGTGTAGGSAQNTLVTVPAGTAHARFRLDSAVDTADLDLSVYRLNDYGDRSLVARAATPSAGEQLDLDAPEEGLYEIDVDFFAGSGPLPYTVTSFVLDSAHAEGALTAKPATAHLESGSTTPVALTWKGLRAGGVYLGRVSYGDMGTTTYLTVTGDPRTGPPTGDPGARPTVSVTPGTALAGRSVAVVATGLTPGVGFRVTLKGSSRLLASGRTTEDGTVGRAVTLPAGLPTGKQTVEIRYGGRTATGTLTVSALVLRDIGHVDRPGFDGNPVVAVVGAISGTGRVEVTVKGRSAVYLDRTLVLDATGLTALDWTSDVVGTTPEKLTATVVPVLDHGRRGAAKSVTWTPVANPASSASITADRSAPHAAKVTFANNTDTVVFPSLRYKLTSGDLVFTALQAEAGTPLTGSYDMTGVDRLDVVLDGATVATYENEDRSRLAGRPVLREPFSATVTRGPSRRDDGRLSMTLTNRPAAYSAFYTLSVGEGTDIYGGRTLLYNQDVPHPTLPDEGTPISRTVSVPAGEPLWATAYYEVQSPVLQYLAVRRVLTTPVDREDLLPVHRTRTGPAFVADALPREAAPGTTVAVTATGLSPREAFTVRLGKRVVGAGRASASGFAHAFVSVPRGSAGTLAVLVTGARSDRTGATEVKVVG